MIMKKTELFLAVKTHGTQLKTPIFKKFARLVYKRDWSTSTIDLHSRLVYKRDWSTCRPIATRFLAVYWLKKSFLSKVKGMNDRGIRQTFPLYALVLPKYEI